MKVLIIEDEDTAAARLKKMIQEADSSFEEIDISSSIKESVNYLENNTPDLIFSDIQLGDGTSFEIFNSVKINVPVIFVTAYDEYAIRAFKLNSVDYLLKPVRVADLKASIEKFKSIFKSKNETFVDYSKIIAALYVDHKSYQKRLVVRYGQNIKTFEIADAAYFFSEEKVTFACTFEGQQFPVDETLDELSDILDPSVFFRINRQFIININSIDSMYSYSKSRVRVHLKPAAKEEAIVSSERSAKFKEWLLGKK